MFRLSRVVMLVAGMIVLSSIVGCATFHLPFARKFPKATASDPVGQIVCLWTPGEGNDPDGVPCKGFMGQVLFLSQNTSKPLEIEGEVRIYLFDDQGTAEEQAKPLRMFNFDNGSWAIHLTDSSFGPAYQVFVPYVRRGVSNANCSLRLRLKPKVGPVVFSEFTNMQLSGYKKTLRGDEAKPIDQEEVDRMAAEAMSQELRRTTTISLDPTAKATDSQAATKQDPNKGQIQLANYQTESEPMKPTADADRIRRLEEMLQQLLEQKTQGSANVAPDTPARWTGHQRQIAPATGDDSGANERIRINLHQKPRTADKQVLQRKPPRRLSHPLDDESPAEAKPEEAPGAQIEFSAPATDKPVEASVESSPPFDLSDDR